MAFIFAEDNNITTVMDQEKTILGEIGLPGQEHAKNHGRFWLG